MFKFREELNLLKEKGLWRSMHTVNSACETYLDIDGKRLLNLCSNNYLGLANSIYLKKAAMSAIDKFGVGQGASRLVLGNTVLHKRLEERIASFKNQESALVYVSGYHANLGIISALASRESIVFSDRLNHASIIDGVILSRAELVRYPHKDLNILDSLLKAHRNKKNKIIITDSIFSMDGDIAPLKGLSGLAKKYGCLLILDDAHATGVLGENGTGALEYFKIPPDEHIIQMGTLSKAVGCLGGFITGCKDLIDYLINRSRPFIFTTSLPAMVVSSAIKAFDIIEKDATLRTRLIKNAEFLRHALRDAGFDILGSQTPIVPVLTKEPKLTMEFSRQLFNEGIFVQGIRPPTVPEGTSRLRLTVMATHKKSDLEFALKRFREIGKDLKVI